MIMVENDKLLGVHLAEDDDAQRIRAWWKKNGMGIISGIALGVLGVGGFKGWEMYTERRALTASNLYQEMLARQSAGSSAQAKNLALRLKDDYGATPYSDLAGLMLAKLAVEEERSGDAEGYLKEIMAEAEDHSMRHIARLRLAQIELAEGNYQKAEKLLSVEEYGGFESEYSEILGDVYVEQKLWKKARTAYDRALESLDSSAGADQILTAKRNLAMQSAGDQ